MCFNWDPLVALTRWTQFSVFFFADCSGSYYLFRSFCLRISDQQQPFSSCRPSHESVFPHYLPLLRFFSKTPWIPGRPRARHFPSIDSRSLSILLHHTTCSFRFFFMPIPFSLAPSLSILAQVRKVHRPVRLIIECRWLWRMEDEDVFSFINHYRQTEVTYDIWSSIAGPGEHAIIIWCLVMVENIKNVYMSPAWTWLVLFTWLLIVGT